MTGAINSLAAWLLDFDLLAMVMVAVALAGVAALRQPAQRLAATKSTLVGLLFLAALSAAPGWSLVHLLTDEPPQANAAAVRDRALDHSYDNRERNRPIPAAARELFAVSEGAPIQAPAAPGRFLPEISWAAVLVGMHAIGALAVTAWLMIGSIAAHCLRRSAQAAPAALVAMMREITGKRGYDSSALRLQVSDRIEVAVALGVWRPTVMLPTKWIKTQNGETIRSVLVHEYVHVRGNDLQWLAVSRILLLLLWAQPHYWLLRRRMRLDQEALADAAAADVSNRHDYAEQLVAWARAVSASSAIRLPTAIGLWEGPSQLRQRIALLVDDRLTVLREASRKWRLATLVLCTLLAAGLSLVTLEPPRQLLADETNESPSADAATGSTKNPPKFLRLRVVDEAGAPIAGATVKPRGLRAENDGSYYGWFADMEGRGAPEAATTNGEGIARVRYPTYIGERRRTHVVALRLTHPAFVAKDEEVPVAAEEPTVTMARGGVLEITGVVPGKAAPVDNLYAVDHEPDAPWTRLENHAIQSPPLAAGRADIRIVWFPEDGPTHFSRVERVELRKGEQTPLRLELRPGTRLVGELAENVPRPVMNGKVVARVDSPGQTDWLDSTEIRADGTFEFQSLPRDEGEIVQLVAICDGFASKPPPGGDAAPYAAPQTASLGEDTVHHVMDMIPTAKCVIELRDSDGEPVVGARVSFHPNVRWMSGGSSIFAHPLVSSKDMILGKATWSMSPEQWRKEYPYQAISDEDGTAHLMNLPPFAPFTFDVEHDEFELPIVDDGRQARTSEVKLNPGLISVAEVTLQPKGSDYIGAAEGDAAPPGSDETPSATDSSAAPVAPGELAGTVVDASGKPLADVTVDAWTWYAGNETTTDEDGRFSLKGFEPKSGVQIEFRKEGYGPSHFANRPTGGARWTVRMDNRTYLEGRVLDADEKPVAGAVIRAERGPFEMDGGIIGAVPTETRSGADGRYRLYVAPDTYDIKIRVPEKGAARYQKQQVREGQQRQFDIRLDPGVTFRATVVNSETGEPVQGIILWNWQLKGIEGTSNADGQLEIPAMAPGNFEFNVSAVGVDRYRSNVAGDFARWWSEEALHKHQQGTELDERGFQRDFDHLEFELSNDAEPVTIYVESCVTVTGRVIDPDGKPVASATVAPAKTGTGNSLTGDTRFSYETKADGTFEMKLPASGLAEYNLIAHDGKYSEWRKWANAAGETFRTQPGERLENVELRLTRPATIRGRVFSDAGQPAAEVEVRAADAGARDNRYYVPTTKTDRDGGFELKFVSPGTHRIQCEPFWLVAAQAPAGTTTIIDVKEGETIEDVTIGSPPSENQRGSRQSSDSPANLIKAATPPAVGEVENEATTPADDADRQNDDASDDGTPDADARDSAAANRPIELTFVIAKHVILHDGKIIEWADVERILAEHPAPQRARPSFKFTHGTLPNREEEIRQKIGTLRKDIQSVGHSWGSVLPRASARYDVIRTAADLVPNEGLRVEGTVETVDGAPVAGAEVVLCPPVDAFIPYKTLDIYLREFQLREPVDEMVTHSDTSGRFDIYPPTGTPYYVVVLSRDGFGLVRSDEFTETKRIVIKPWARIEGRVKPDVRFNQSADVTVRIPETGGWPELTFHQYSSDIDQPFPDGKFAFRFVSPALKGWLSRSIENPGGGSIGLPYQEFELRPGEILSIEIEPPADTDIKRFEEIQRDSASRRAQSDVSTD